MLTQTTTQNTSETRWEATPANRPRSLASRLPQRSVRQVYEVPLNHESRSSLAGSEVPSFSRRQHREKSSRVGVAAIPSRDNSCRHHLFVDDGTRLQKLDLPSTACVAVSQRFEAKAGDRLLYDYVVRLKSKKGIGADRPAVRAVLVNRATDSAVSLMDRSLKESDVEQPERTGSRFRESQSYTVPSAGLYELRFITFVDGGQPGSEAELLVNAVRVVDATGNEVRRLASLSCAGRVRRFAIA
jgi:hypothetical protein